MNDFQSRLTIILNQVRRHGKLERAARAAGYGGHGKNVWQLLKRSRRGNAAMLIAWPDDFAPPVPFHVAVEEAKRLWVAEASNRPASDYGPPESRCRAAPRKIEEAKPFFEGDLPEAVKPWDLPPYHRDYKPRPSAAAPKAPSALRGDLERHLAQLREHGPAHPLRTLRDMPRIGVGSTRNDPAEGIGSGRENVPVIDHQRGTIRGAPHIIRK